MYGSLYNVQECKKKMKTALVLISYFLEELSILKDYLLDNLIAIILSNKQQYDQLQISFAISF
jgi:hypothetical protein